MRFINLLILSVIASAVSLAQTSPAAAAEVPATPGLYAIFDTSLGQIVAELYEKQAPLTVKNFVDLAKGVKAARN